MNYLVGDSALTLAFVYVVLVLPFAYRAIDSSLSSLDATTLAEAARSLGASWFTVITRVIVPNIWPGVLGAAFIAVALVLGEFTIASLLALQHAARRDRPDQQGQRTRVDGCRPRVTAVRRAPAGGAVVPRPPSQHDPGRELAHVRHSPRVQPRGRRRDDAGCAGRTATCTPSTVSTCTSRRARWSSCSGPSGCGKTTALRILAGLERQDAGTIIVGGKDLSSVPANKRDMGMVFQAYSLFPHLTVLDNVAFGLKLRGRSRSERRKRAGDMLDLVGLGEHKDRYANQLSGGQQQRVALARALAIEPSVLLLDEPLSALDAKVRVQLRDEIRRVQLDVGTTTLFVTHDQEEALAIADRVGVMNAGRLDQIAPPAELYAAPATPFVGQFVGLSNRIPATVSDGTADVLGVAVPVLPGSATGSGRARAAGVGAAHRGRARARDRRSRSPSSGRSRGPR